MASCAYCNTSIIFGGVTEGSQKFCNENCHAAGYFINLANEVDPELISKMVVASRHGACPCCQRTGSPVDVHKAHKIWSILVMTSWSSTPELSCKACGVKRQLGAILFSGTLGWWGFPWGIIGTPVQILRNFGAMAAGPKGDQPSALLHKHVQLLLGQQLAADIQAQEQTVPTPPPLPG
jgi:hypothetical protein